MDDARLELLITYDDVWDLGTTQRSRPGKTKIILICLAWDLWLLRYTLVSFSTERSRHAWSLLQVPQAKAVFSQRHVARKGKRNSLRWDSGSAFRFRFGFGSCVELNETVQRNRCHLSFGDAGFYVVSPEQSRGLYLLMRGKACTYSATILKEFNHLGAWTIDLVQAFVYTGYFWRLYFRLSKRLVRFVDLFLYWCFCLWIPRYFHWRVLVAEFELNLIVIFDDDHLVMETFEINLVRPLWFLKDWFLFHR